MAKSATWEGQGTISPLSIHSNKFTTPLGIPQGSASSAAVAERSVSQLKLDGVADAAFVNYADNFFLLAKNGAALKLALQALRSAIAVLPGGTFETAIKQDTTLAKGFNMLGCKILLADSGIDVFPNDAALDKLDAKIEQEKMETEAFMLSAQKTASDIDRLKVVQAYLRLKNHIDAWVAAYAFSEGFTVISDNLEARMQRIRFKHAITDAKLKKAADHSTNLPPDLYPD